MQRAIEILFFGQKMNFYEFLKSDVQLAQKSLYTSPNQQKVFP